MPVTELELDYGRRVEGSLSKLSTLGDGARILRIKGLLNVAGDPLPRVLQCVQHSVYPPTSLPAWPRVRASAARTTCWPRRPR